SVSVAKGSQAIAFTSTAPADAAVGGASHTGAGVGGASGGTATVSAGSPSTCAVSGSTVSFTGAGACAIDANQAGNANFQPAPQARQSVSVAKGSQAIAFTSTAPADAAVGGAPYTVAARR